MSETWNEGKLHATNGPAIDKLRQGKSFKQWWENGRYMKMQGEYLPRLQPETIPDYPQGMPLSDAVSLGDFFDKQSNYFEEIANWIDRKCYSGQNVFTTHGDFGAQVKVMVNDFFDAESLNAESPYSRFLDKLLTEVKVKISNEDDDETINILYPENGRAIDTNRAKSDLLGAYKYSTQCKQDAKCIVLYMRRIIKCAGRIDDEIYCETGSLCAMTLFYKVFLHELGHAIHHVMSGYENLGEPEICESLAQHFTMTCIMNYGNARSKKVFEELESRQHAVYRMWRDLELCPCKWINCRKEYEKNPAIITNLECLNKLAGLDPDGVDSVVDILQI